MEQHEVRQLLQKVAAGQIDVEQALLGLKMAPFEEIDIASLDHHRGIRQGASEIIYGAGKSPEQIDKIAHSLWNSGQKTILITRMSQEAAEYFQRDIPFTYFAEARVGLVGQKIAPKHEGYILVATGGTSDIPVAEEAALTAEIMGNRVERLYDVGVAGIHRLLAHGRQGDYRYCRDGRSPCFCHRRSCRLSGDCGTYQRRLWHSPWRCDSTFVHAELLRQRSQCCQYRQWLWRWISGKFDQ